MELLTGLGLAVPAGLNAYIPLLAVAIAEAAGWIDLPQPYALIGEWWSVALIAVLLVIEVFADKVPGVDHVNDVIQTVMLQRPEVWSSRRRCRGAASTP